MRDAPDVARALLTDAVHIYTETQVDEARSGLGTALFLLGELALERGGSTEALNFFRDAAGLFMDRTFDTSSPYPALP